MASSNANSSVFLSSTSFTFMTPVKLDRSNWRIWKSQVLSSVRGNGIEDLLNGTKPCPNQFLQSESANNSSTTEARSNPTYETWLRQD